MGGPGTAKSKFKSVIKEWKSAQLVFPLHDSSGFNTGNISRPQRIPDVENIDDVRGELM
jgi:hypothetical protein